MNDAPRAVVTGAASGIGLAVAQALLARGWQVLGLDRQPRPALLRAAEWLVCDLDDAAARETACAALLQCAPWQALVSCAGVAGIGSIERVLRINFIAARGLVERLAPHLADGGAMVLLSSGAGMRWPQRLERLRPVLEAGDESVALARAAALCEAPAQAYVVSKELLSLYGAWRCLHEWRRGLRLNVVSPGSVDTPLIPAFTQSMGTEAMRFAQAVAGRHGRPEEVAEAVVFLCSPQSAWINGAELRVDGGLTGALTAGVARFDGWT